MLGKIKIILGLILIVVSFIYILRRPGVSMMESLMQQREKKAELARAKQEEEARLAALKSESEEASGVTTEQESTEV